MNENQTDAENVSKALPPSASKLLFLGESPPLSSPIHHPIIEIDMRHSRIYIHNALSMRIPRRKFSQSPTHLNLTPFTRRLLKLPTPPPPSSQHHNDLPSFLSYAERTSLSQTNTTYVGTHYEYTVLQSLRQFAFTLHRVGGRDDAGVDLVGTWHLPEREQRALRVFVQCKALKAKAGPNFVRELEGTFRSSPIGWRTGKKVGVLVSTRDATKGVREAMARSAYPLFWMMMERDGTLQQALWNTKVEDLGLGLLGVEMRYAPGSLGDSEKMKSVVLTWDGKDIPDMDQVEKRIAGLEDQWLASLGSGDGLSDAGKLELLNIVEESFPDVLQSGIPLGTGNTLSDDDRTKVLQALDARLKARAAEIDSPAA